MAEAILFNLAGSLSKNLGSRALDEIASARGFKTRLDKLKNTVNTIKDVLLDAEERQFESSAVRGWLDRLKAPLYAADDLFDEFATMASQREAVGKVHTFFSGSNHIAFAFNISRKIKKIREELDDIVKDSSQFAFVLRPLEEGRFQKRVRDQSHSSIDVEEVIGREDDREAIVDTLMSSSAAKDKRLSVIAIVGIGGLGKTTLAQLVYNDERVEKNFELKLWVCVSEVFDRKEIIKKILMSATDSECRNLELDQLQGQLKREIGGKKYLLVLDDVWNENRLEWLNLSETLNVGGEGSMILVTTRSRTVANVMKSVPAYDLEYLSEQKSWALFEKMAFEPGPGESQKNLKLLKLGEAIVKKCGGVPLALVTLGTLLYGNDEQKWASIAARSFAEMSDEQNVIAVLKLSYHNLPSPIKNCFAYCALFPKNFKFQKETLIDLWMAEGFVISAIETQSLRELGDEYLVILLQRCFFQNIIRDKLGNISSFKMHDLMHDLALEVAGAGSKMAKVQDENFSNRIRHLSLDYRLGGSWEIPTSMLKAKYLRTFLLPNQSRDGSDFNKEVLQQLISSFRCIRLLDLSNLGIRTVPKSIGKLIHLRYLNLSDNPIKELPNSVTELQNLQTLLLYGCDSLKALPIHNRKLTNLRTLDVLGCYKLTHLPPGLGDLTSLHKLPYFIVKSKLSSKVMRNAANAQLRDLKNLDNLSGYLHIKLCEELEDPASEAKEANLIDKHGLTHLYIEMNDILDDHDIRVVSDETIPEDLLVKMRGIIDGGHRKYEAVLEGLKPHRNLKKLEIREYRGENLPSWAMTDSLCTTLPNLVEISLVLFYDCREVPCFSQLPFLKCLTLQHLKSVEYMEKSVHEVMSPLSPYTGIFFPSLQELELSGMDNLKGWWEETNVVDCSDEEKLSEPSTQCHPQSPSFSGLLKLQIRMCPHLASFPLAPNVEELKLQKVNKDLTVLKKLASPKRNSDGSSEYSSKLVKLSIDEREVLSSMPEECLRHVTSLEILDTKLENTSQIEGVFKRLSSLTTLEFRDCHSLTTVSVGMEHLVSLEALELSECSQLDMSENGEIKESMPWKALTALRFLSLYDLDKLEHLPSGIQRLTNLHTLMISNNKNLEELPKWIGCLSSLEYMEIFNCQKLRCLPEEIRKLTSLNGLSIAECRGLTKRCRGPNGADWPYIRHIPCVAVEEYEFV